MSAIENISTTAESNTKIHANVKEEVKLGFLAALQAELDADDDVDEEEKCLITDEVLTEENKIVLPCGHKFTFDALYKEVVKQKTEFNNYETIKLKRMQIKCPYCRAIHDKLLPQKEGYENVLGVNRPVKYCMGYKQCEHILTRGKNKGMRCTKLTFGRFCSVHCKLKSNCKTK